MSSQTQMCEEHGYMLPIGVEYAITNDQGQIVAMVCWWNPDHDGTIEEVIYAIDEESLALVPRLNGEANVGNWLQASIEAGHAHEYYWGVAYRHPNVLRIDDCRPEGGWSYRIYSGDKQETPSLIPGAVYYCYVDCSDYPRGERLQTFGEVKALTELPEAVRITDVGQLYDKSFGDPEVVAVFGDMSAAVRVTDEYAVQHNIEASLKSR